MRSSVGAAELSARRDGVTVSRWHDAADALFALDPETMTIDQKLRRAEVMALLSIGQELSIIHSEGINPQFRAG